MGRTMCAVALALLLTSMRVSAHHAFAAEYDKHKLVSVSAPSPISNGSIARLDHSAGIQTRMAGNPRKSLTTRASGGSAISSYSTTNKA